MASYLLRETLHKWLVFRVFPHFFFSTTFTQELKARAEIAAYGD